MCDLDGDIGPSVDICHMSKTFQADFEGDTLNYMGLDPHLKVVRSAKDDRNTYNNLSLRAKVAYKRTVRLVERSFPEDDPERTAAIGLCKEMLLDLKRTGAGIIF